MFDVFSTYFSIWILGYIDCAKLVDLFIHVLHHKCFVVFWLTSKESWHFETFFGELKSSIRWWVWMMILSLLERTLLFSSEWIIVRTIKRHHRGRWRRDTKWRTTHLYLLKTKRHRWYLHWWRRAHFEWMIWERVRISKWHMLTRELWLKLFLKFFFNFFHLNHIVFMIDAYLTSCTKVKEWALCTFVSNSNYGIHSTTITFNFMLCSLKFYWLWFFISQFIFDFLNDTWHQTLNSFIDESSHFFSHFLFPHFTAFTPASNLTISYLSLALLIFNLLFRLLNDNLFFRL